MIRPGDANETSEAIRAAYEFDGPTVVVLSRQNLPVVTDGSAVTHGAGIVHAVDGAPEAVIVATGSEVHLAIAAAQELGQAGRKVQAVSLPSWDRFEAYRSTHPELAERILPKGVPTVSVEAGSTFGWERYADVCIGIDRFGASAPGAEVLDRLGISVSNVKNSVLGLLTAK